MAIIKIFSAEGVKEIKCFDTLSEIPYLPVEAADPTEDLEQLSEE